MLRYFLSVIIFISLNIASTIRGQIVDDNGVPLQNASVFLIGTDQGTYTDIDGYFILTNISEGSYSIQVNYLGFKSYLSDQIEIYDGEISTYNVFMEPDIIQGQTISIKGELNKESTSTIIQDRKKSTVVEDAISSEEISKSGDSNVADAVKRISGVSVTDGKFAVVRGLSTRYTNTILNSAPIPSPEADKKVLPLDVVPTSLLESIAASKTYTPDMPGSFAGGNINIKTKAYPDSRILNFKFSSNYKDKLNRDNYYLKNDSFFGFDNNK